jgi:hypothetical protein
MYTPRCIRPETGVTIGIRLCVLPDNGRRDAFERTAEFAKENIEALTGIQVNEIGVLVESAAARRIRPPPLVRLSEDRIITRFGSLSNNIRFTVLLVLGRTGAGDSVFHHRFLAHDPAFLILALFFFLGYMLDKRRPEGIRDFLPQTVFQGFNNT